LNLNVIILKFYKTIFFRFYVAGGYMQVWSLIEFIACSYMKPVFKSRHSTYLIYLSKLSKFWAFLPLSFSFMAISILAMLSLLINWSWLSNLSGKMISLPWPQVEFIMPSLKIKIVLAFNQFHQVLTHDAHGHLVSFNHLKKVLILLGLIDRSCV